MPAAGSILLYPNPAENFPLYASVVVAAMYWLGGRRFRAACRRGTIGRARIRTERKRSTCFALGLVAIVFALQEPMDGWSDRLFWVHMVQHMLLIVVSAPLIVLGAPWMRVFKALPLSSRRSLALWAVRGRTGAPLRAIARGVGKPKVAWGLLVADVLLWHIPAAYDLTLRSEAVHYTEHATFLIFALFAWGHLVESPPLHPVISEPFRIAFAFTQMVVMWLLGLALAFATEPWYSHYAKLLHRPGGISAITDQHLAGGIMWIPASIPWGVAILVWVYHWVAEAWQQEGAPPGEPARLPVTPPAEPPPRPAGRPVLVPEPALSHVAAHPDAGARGLGDSEQAVPGRRIAEPIARAAEDPPPSGRRVEEPIARAVVHPDAVDARRYHLSHRSNASPGATPQTAPESRRRNA
ncbi:MAG: cytochrome c oxidase assembly protein [Solirubrobacteraceae bacterium]